MTVTISYSNKLNTKNSSNNVFVNENFNTNHLKKFLSNTEHSFVNELLKNRLEKKLISF